MSQEYHRAAIDSEAKGRRAVSPRIIVAVAGTVLWLGLMLFVTGASGVVAMGTGVAFLVPLVLIGTPTRTITLATIGRFVLIGGFLMGVAALAGGHYGNETNSPLRDFSVPPMEETLKIAPLLFLLWRRRHTGTWSFGATDLLLMGAAIGTGFGLVESANVRHVQSWGGHVPLIPVTSIGSGGHLMVGHDIWNSIIGGMLGLALLIRRPRSIAVLIGAAGIAFTTVDHISNNYRIGHSGFVRNLLEFLTANGWLALLFFFAVVVAAIGADLWIARTCVPAIAELAPPPLGGDRESLAASWRFRLHRRALAYTFLRARRAPEGERPEAMEEATAILARMFLDRRGKGERS